MRKPKPDPYNYYPIWTGALNFGDTPGVFYDSQFVGLILQFPIYISYIPSKLYIELVLITNEVEINDGNYHNVYFDWKPGQPLPSPIGQIDDREYFPNIAEYHILKVATNGLQLGNHTLSILVNTKTPSGLQDDFILYEIDADNEVGMRLGSIYK